MIFLLLPDPLLPYSSPQGQRRGSSCIQKKFSMPRTRPRKKFVAKKKVSPWLLATSADQKSFCVFLSGPSAMENRMKKLFTTKQAAASLEVSPSLMKQWRATGKGPRFLVLEERLVRYTAEDLQTYLDRLQRKSCGTEDQATNLCADDHAPQGTTAESEAVR